MLDARVEERFWLSPMVRLAPPLMVTALLLPTLLSDARVLFAAIARVAAAGFDEAGDDLPLDRDHVGDKGAHVAIDRA